MRIFYIALIGFFFTVSARAAVITAEDSVGMWVVNYAVGNTDTLSQAYRFTTVTVTDVNVARCAYLSMAYTTVDDMQMFMKMYMLAKVSGLKMTIAYDDTTCILKRFGLKPVPN